MYMCVCTYTEREHEYGAAVNATSDEILATLRRAPMEKSVFGDR